mmetsp:Transcript_3632/g.10511  ORF Transcript_3632/g.10511 Transcript_3632/m.10511 type:complete len:322 (-) Transcript_3632:4742-5707(-)
MLALRPDGGSLVSLMEFCRIGTGTTFCGSAERKTRKSGCAPSMRLSSFFSSLGSQRATSSMFWSIAQPPSTYILSRAFSATGSWPWPKETVTNLPCSSVLPIWWPSWRTGTTGSTPGERRKKMGTAGAESSKDTLRSKGIASTYLLPMASRTQMAMASIMRSGRSARTTCRRWKPPRRFHSWGSGIFSGVSDSIHSFHRFQEPSTSEGRPAKVSEAESATTENHAASCSQVAHGFSRSKTLGALMSTSTSSWPSSPWACSTFMVSRLEKMRRWRSKSPRVTNWKAARVTTSERFEMRCAGSSWGGALRSARLKTRSKEARE